jgi:hypothetical protein
LIDSILENRPDVWPNLNSLPTILGLAWSFTPIFSQKQGSGFLNSQIYFFKKTIFTMKMIQSQWKIACSWKIDGMYQKNHLVNRPSDFLHFEKIRANIYKYR